VEDRGEFGAYYLSYAGLAFGSIGGGGVAGGGASVVVLAAGHW